MNEYLQKQGKIKVNIDDTNKENVNDDNQIDKANSIKHRDSDFSMLSSKDNGLSD